MNYKFTLIPADPAKPIENREVDWPDGPTYERFKELKPLICGEHDDLIEHVTVFDEGRYKDMFVSEEGRMRGFPFNERASKIYWNNSIVHQGMTEEELRKSGFNIVGDAVLFEKGVWE